MNNQDNEKVFQNSNINWFPGHMKKTKMEIASKFKQIDVVYEVIDARIPFSSKIKDIYKMIQNKPKIIIMTKKDLCDIKKTEVWVKYYENLGSKVLLLDLNDNNSYKEIYRITKEFLKEKNVLRDGKDMLEKEIHALVVGIPNVGKSTLINKLCGRKVAVTGNSPGVTKHLSWLKASNNILLLDTPGILWPKFENNEEALNLASFTAINEKVIPIVDVASHILKKLSNYYPTILKDLYNLDKYDDDVIEESFITIGKKIGAYKNGEVDYNRVALKIINDIKSERIKGVTFDNERRN